MTWMVWLGAYLVLVSLVLLFFAGISSSERFEEEAARRPMPWRGSAGPMRSPERP